MQGPKDKGENVILTIVNRGGYHGKVILIRHELRHAVTCAKRESAMRGGTLEHGLGACVNHFRSRAADKIKINAPQQRNTPVQFFIRILDRLDRVLVRMFTIIADGIDTVI